MLKSEFVTWLTLRLAAGQEPTGRAAPHSPANLEKVRGRIAQRALWRTQTLTLG